MKNDYFKDIRLLLVDDEDGFRQAIARRLEKRGLITLQAANGETCLNILEKEPMDVVVLDVKMPGMNGIETLKAIKNTFQKIEVILLTGDAAIADGIEGIKSGAFDYLTKPVEIDHLFNKIIHAADRIRLEREREEEAAYRAKLERKMIDTERLISLGKLSTGIAHEINNPLAIINEAAGFMKAVVFSGDMMQIPRREALLTGIEKIEKSVVRARKITHQLLGHVKEQPSEFTETDVRALLNETLDLVKKELESKNIEVIRQGGMFTDAFSKTAADPDTRKADNINGAARNGDARSLKYMIWSDPYQIRQIFINLLTNAAHAVDMNGKISLNIEEDADGVSVSIEDNGIGIPGENISKIFDPFFTTSKTNEGSGLGLYVVHKLLDNLNGFIEVKSRVGNGTTMILRLPRSLK